MIGIPIFPKPRLVDLPVGVGQDVVAMDRDGHGVVVQAVDEAETTAKEDQAIA